MQELLNYKYCCSHMLLTSAFKGTQMKPPPKKSKCATLNKVNTCKPHQKFVRVDSIKAMQNKIAKPGPSRQRESETEPTGTRLLLINVVYVHLDVFLQNRSERNSLERGCVYTHVFKGEYRCECAVCIPNRTVANIQVLGCDRSYDNAYRCVLVHLHAVGRTAEDRRLLHIQNVHFHRGRVFKRSQM